MTNAQNIVINKLIELAGNNDEVNNLFNSIAFDIAKFETEKVTILHKKRAGKADYFELMKYHRGTEKYLARKSTFKEAKLAREHYMEFGYLP